MSRKLENGTYPTKEEIEELKKEMVIQENILTSLQRENEKFLVERKGLLQRIKDLEERNANLEAKYSLLRSASEFASPAPDETINGLRKTIDDLKEALNEAEKIKSIMQQAIHEKQGTEEEEVTRTREVTPNPNDTVSEVLPDFKLEQSTTQGSRKSSTAQAYQYRLVEQLKETIEKQKDEIRILNQRLLSGPEDMTRRMERNDVDPVSSATTKAPSMSRSPSVHSNEIKVEEKTAKKSEERIGLSKGGEVLAPDNNTASDALRAQERRMKQLENALVEKDKAASFAVEKLKTETSRIRLYYENAIKKIIADRTSENEKKKMDTAPAKDLEKDLLKARVMELEGTLRHRESTSQREYIELSSKVELLTEQMLIKQKETDELTRRLHEKNTEVARLHVASREELLARIESQREEHHHEINRLQEQHDAELRRLVSSKRTKEFTEKLKKKWLQVKEKSPEIFMSTVVDRLAFLENYCLQKDAEMELSVAQILRVSEMETKLLKQKAEITIEQKNLQIQEFQQHLDSLMKTVALLKYKEEGVSH